MPVTPETPVRASLESGLSASDVELLRRTFGLNEVVRQKPSPLGQLAGKFWGPSAWMLEAIAVVSWQTGREADLFVAVLLLAVNAAVSFRQERRAEGIVETLRQRLSVRARVLRDREWQAIPARDLVPGDVVRLRPGDLAPADVEIAEGSVTVDQSVLTGESLDVDKMPASTVHSGSTIRQGEATGRVTQTGARTYFGKTVELVQIARPRLHVEDVVGRLARWLFAIVGTMIGGLVAVALARGAPPAELLPMALALLLGAVPVALPVMFTVSMAVGARQLARHGILVTRLSAVEDAAAMDTLWVDKTGTITQNRVAVARVIPANGFSQRDVLVTAAWASQEADQDPIDLAVLAAARAHHSLDDAEIRRIDFVPFDASRRRTEATVESNGRRVIAIKGAVDTVASLCGLNPPASADLDRQAEEQALRGYRALAVARAIDGKAPQLMGLVTLQDPPRPDAAELIEALENANVSVKMLTGDALPIASEVARQVGLPPVRSMPARVAGTTIDPAAIDPAVGGLAGVLPEDKYRVVKALQGAGHVTGMTGDGVNDSPALRQAEVGIAVSSAADIAKGAASVVLTTEGLPGIVALVREGRVVSQRILTWIVNKVSRTILKSAYVAIAFLLTGRFVISALGLIVVVFLTDFVVIALATDRAQGGTRPYRWSLAGPVKLGTVMGVLLLGESLTALWLAWRLFGLGTNDRALQTFSFQLLLYFSLFSIVSIREPRRFWASLPSQPLTAALTATAVLGVVLCHIRLPGLSPVPTELTAFSIAAAMITSLVINDWGKAVMLRRHDMSVPRERA